MTDERLILCMRIALAEQASVTASADTLWLLQANIRDLRRKLDAVPAFAVVTSPHDEMMAAKEKLEEDARLNERACRAFMTWGADMHLSGVVWNTLSDASKDAWRAVARALTRD